MSREDGKGDFVVFWDVKAAAAAAAAAAPERYLSLLMRQRKRPSALEVQLKFVSASCHSSNKKHFQVVQQAETKPKERQTSTVRRARSKQETNIKDAARDAVLLNASQKQIFEPCSLT